LIPADLDHQRAAIGGCDVCVSTDGVVSGAWYAPASWVKGVPMSYSSRVDLAPDRRHLGYTSYLASVSSITRRTSSPT
jgi:hypothetical protein